jgi:predicted nucleotidyltransferase
MTVDSFTKRGSGWAMVAMREIRALGRRIAERFKPRRIVLFGSYAYGTPTEDSDVDLFIIMRNRVDEVHKAVEIRLTLDVPFPMDIVVRTPVNVRKRLAMGDPFVQDILERGRVLYEAPDA